MEIKTKYNIGDEVWWINENKAQTGEIVSIHFHQWSDTSCTMEYTISRYDVDERHKVYETFLFPTKEELLKSLKLWQ